jgi:phosphoenolpyruvate-protein kinase (PTS system EI component)
MVNIRGQLIHNVDIGTITEGKSSFVISEGNPALGIYIIRLLSDKKVIYTGKVQ